MSCVCGSPAGSFLSPVLVLQVEVAILELETELEGKGLSRSVIDACLADRRATLTAQAEAGPAAPAAAKADKHEPAAPEQAAAEAPRCITDSETALVIAAQHGSRSEQSAQGSKAAVRTI